MTSARRQVPALVAPAMMLVLFGGCATAGSQQNSDITVITVDAEEVYLTLEGEPYVLSVKKP